MQLLQVGVHEGVSGVNLRRNEAAEEALPPRVCLLVGDNCLLVGLATGDRLDQLVAVGGVDLHIRVGAVVELPSVLKRGPVDRGAVVVVSLIHDGVGDHGLAVHNLILHLAEVGRVRVVGTVTVEKRELRVVLVPNVARVAVHVCVENVLLLSHLGDGHGQLAAVLDLVALQRVVVTSSLDLKATGGLASGLCSLARLSGGGAGAGGLRAVTCTCGESQGNGGQAGDCGDANAVLHVTGHPFGRKQN